MAKRMTRWTKTWADVFDHEVVGVHTGMTGYWLDLVSLASGVDGFDGVGRGQLRASRRFLARRWPKLTEKQVRGFLDRLVRANMLIVSSQNRAHDPLQKGPRSGRSLGQSLSVYTIANYDKYQGGDEDGANERAHDRAQTPLKKGPSLKKGKELKDSPPLPPSPGEVGEPHPALPMLADADRANGVDPTTPLQLDPQPSKPEPKVQVASETKPKRTRKASVVPAGDAKLAIERWNQVATAKGLDPVTFVNATVESHVRARLAEVGGIEGWDRALKIVEQSPFLLGKVSPKVPGKKPFKATLGWVTGPVNFAKVMNGSYLDARAKQASRSKPEPTPIRDFSCDYPEGFDPSNPAPFDTSDFGKNGWGV